MSILRGTAAAALLVALTVGSTGCIKKMLLDGQIKGTRQGSGAVNTLQDYEVANAVAFAGLGQMEGMHKLAPDNTDALFMLTKSWSGASFAFIEDKYEQAYEKGDDVMAEYHLMRARAAYQRAIFYGLELLSHHAEGFKKAKRNQATMHKWLAENFTDKDQAEDLLWTGYAWVGRVGVSKDVPAVVGELYVGVEMVKRSVELDETLDHAMGHTILGAYYASFKEFDKSKAEFDRALKLTGGKYLPIQLNYAVRYYCAKSDKANYMKMLNDVLKAGDTLPGARLQNVIAKRRARRYLGNQIWQEECGFAQ